MSTFHRFQYDDFITKRDGRKEIYRCRAFCFVVNYTLVKDWRIKMTIYDNASLNKGEN